MEEREFRYLLNQGRTVPRHLDRDVQKLRDGDPAGLKSVLTFLELDPWGRGAGYLKEDLIKLVTRVELGTRAAERLRQVVLNVVDGRDRREFRRYCALARKVYDPELRDELLKRLGNEEPVVRRHAGWVLDACEGPHWRERWQGS